MKESTKEILNQYLERYEIDQRIGSGGMARVYRGYDTSLNRMVAIKVLYEHLSQETSFRERFEREAQLVARLNHPNIVQVYDFNMIPRGDELIYYMVMSYIPGQTLQEILDSHWAREQMLPHDRVLEIIEDMADALDYAHERGMVHRDVKPANILFDDRDRAVLTDFGIARMAQSSGLTQEGNTVGTPMYMSPEQATGDLIDSRSDIYGLGIILYEMLTGRPPFTDDGGLSVLLKHLNAPVPSLQGRVQMPNTSTDLLALEAVVFKGLAKLPEDRYQTAKEFAEDLRCALSGQPVQAVLSGSTRELSTGPLAAVKLEVLSADLMAPTKSRSLFRSPLLLFIGGLVIVTAVIVFGFLSDQQSAASGPVDMGLSESMTDAIYFTGTFDSDDILVDYWPQGMFNLVTREITDDGFYRINSDLADTAVATPFEDASNYTDISIQMVGVLEEGSSPASGYGLIFRYQDENNYNVFAVDGTGRFSIWVREDGVWRELRGTEENWTTNPAVVRIGEMNLLSMEISGDEISAFVNGEWVASIVDDTFDDGGIGIYLASPPNGRASILVDMFQVMDSPLILGESMTGN